MLIGIILYFYWSKKGEKNNLHEENLGKKAFLSYLLISLTFFIIARQVQEGGLMINLVGIFIGLIFTTAYLKKKFENALKDGKHIVTIKPNIIYTTDLAYKGIKSEKYKYVKFLTDEMIKQNKNLANNT